MECMYVRTKIYNVQDSLQGFVASFEEPRLQLNIMVEAPVNIARTEKNGVVNTIRMKEGLPRKITPAC